jgi:hypothetical protein
MAENLPQETSPSLPEDIFLTKSAARCCTGNFPVFHGTIKSHDLFQNPWMFSL